MHNTLRAPLLTLLLIYITGFCAQSQEPQYTVVNNNFLKFVAGTRFDGCNFKFIPSNSVKIINFKPSSFWQYNQVLFNINGNLIIYLSGTGLVYKASLSENADSVRFYRLDKTRHADYNINCFPFVYDNNIYNIGGYGFWHWNGNLRKFNEKLAEWNIVPLNIELPLSIESPGFPFWISQKENVLFSFGYVRGNEAIKSNESRVLYSVDTIMKLDLKSMDWTVVGKQNEKINQSLQLAGVLANLDSGILINNLGKIQYLNLLRNRIFNVNNRETIQILSANMSEKITWFKNDKFYYFDPKMGKIDSISKSAFDFVSTNERVFSSNKYLSLFIRIIISLLTAGLFFYLWIVKGGKKLLYFTKKNKLNGLVSPFAGKEVFDEVEKALIRLLIENRSTKNCRTATDDVNRVLGVGSKSTDMQKRKRSDVIRSINAKYRILMPETNIQLVDRVKNDGDGRLYEYFVADTEVINLTYYIA